MKKIYQNLKLTCFAIREQSSDYPLNLTQDSQFESGDSGESVNFIQKTDHPSHLQYNDQWKYDSRNLNGLYNYINQLTLGANTLLGKVLEDKVNPNHLIFT